MLENEILALVDKHYEDPKAEVLLLSNLGSVLIEKALWPDNSNRTLFDVVSAIPDLIVVRDDVAPSFYPRLSSLWRFVWPILAVARASWAGAELRIERSA